MNAWMEQARRIAEQAHGHQLKKKSGEPFIEHVRRVVASVSHDDEKVVAWLHDVVEKAPDWPFEQLRLQGFPEEIMAAVEALTRREGEADDDFVRRAGSNALARPVKRADLSDNLATAERTGHDGSKYRNGLRILAEEFGG